MFETTGLDILLRDTRQRPIITLCRKLDSAIGNGIPMEIITELCGAPGTGKTQLCLQLCANVQIPKSIGGVGGKAIFIDTNQGFNPHRMKGITESCTKRYEDVFKKPGIEQNSIEFTVENVLSSTSYYYCKDRFELQATVETLNDVLKSESNIKLIVIDSICFPFRTMDDYLNRIRILHQLLTTLQMYAYEYELAVVLTNDVTTRFDEKNQPEIVPALGDCHSHKIGQRILLGRKPNTSDQFVAFLNKTIYSPPQYCGFKITKGGIRGVD